MRVYAHSWQTCWEIVCGVQIRSTLTKKLLALQRRQCNQRCCAPALLLVLADELLSQSLIADFEDIAKLPMISPLSNRRECSAMASRILSKLALNCHNLLCLNYLCWSQKSSRNSALTICCSTSVFSLLKLAEFVERNASTLSLSNISNALWGHVQVYWLPAELSGLSLPPPPPNENVFWLFPFSMALVQKHSPRKQINHGKLVEFNVILSTAIVSHSANSVHVTSPLSSLSILANT